MERQRPSVQAEGGASSLVRTWKQALPGCVVVALLLVALPVQAQSVTGQYIAKGYSEGLGRAPDQQGWLNAVNFFAANGCSASTLRTFFAGIYLSTEFENLGYHNAARLLALYRGVHNRDPQQQEFDNNLQWLEAGVPWATIVDGFLGGSEFTNHAWAKCNFKNYGFGDNFGSIVQRPVGAQGFSGTQAQLQALIDSTPPGGTVWLAERSVVVLNSTLTVKAGVTVATFGSPGPNRYATMARLARGSNFLAPLIRLMPGATLRNTWIDGMRNHLPFSFDDINIETVGGSGTSVVYNRIGNPTGGTNIKAWNGAFQGQPCVGNHFSFNLIDAYTSSHYNHLWSDGVTLVCEDAIVEYNNILDASDVPIVVFGAYPAVQVSQVRYNTILNVGNSAYGGLVFDSWHSMGITQDFTGAVIHNNTIWSGPAAHFDIGLSLGTRPWFGNDTNRAVGAAMTFNTSGISKINLHLGTSVSGMESVADMSGNTLDRTPVSVSPCPFAAYAAAVTAGWASGNLAPGYLDVDISECAKH